VLSRLLSSPNQQSLEESSILITTLLKLHTLLAVLIHTIVPPLLHALILPILDLLIGQSRFPPATLLPILYAYLYYIPIMAVNGVSESFIASVASTGDLAKQSRAMIIFSLVFLGSSWGLVKWLNMGGEGLVWANCINLGVRIIWSCQFITTWYTARKANVGWNRVLPQIGTVIFSVLIGIGMRMVCAWELDGFIEALLIAGVGALSLIGCM
jgi:oligosaccharide translocation protein RFT1